MSRARIEAPTRRGRRWVTPHAAASCRCSGSRDKGAAASAAASTRSTVTAVSSWAGLPDAYSRGICAAATGSITSARSCGALARICLIQACHADGAIGASGASSKHAPVHSHKGAAASSSVAVRASSIASRPRYSRRPCAISVMRDSSTGTPQSSTCCATLPARLPSALRRASRRTSSAAYKRRLPALSGAERSMPRLTYEYSVGTLTPRVAAASAAVK